jgi:hypothetical protein
MGGRSTRDVPEAIVRIGIVHHESGTISLKDEKTRQSLES